MREHRIVCALWTSPWLWARQASARLSFWWFLLWVEARHHHEAVQLSPAIPQTHRSWGWCMQYVVEILRQEDMFVMMVPKEDGVQAAGCDAWIACPSTYHRISLLGSPAHEWTPCAWRGRGKVLPFGTFLSGNDQLLFVGTCIKQSQWWWQDLSGRMAKNVLPNSNRKYAALVTQFATTSCELSSILH